MLIDRCAQALSAAQRLVDALCVALREQLTRADPDPGIALQLEQARAHGLAWAATYQRGLAEMLDWARRLQRESRLGELESDLLGAAFAEYCAQLAQGLPMSQGEIFRARTLDAPAAARFAADASVTELCASGFDGPVRIRIAAAIARGASTRSFGDPAYDDPALAEVREQFARWADDHAGAAHRWHLANALIPDAVVAELGSLGVFGLTLPEQWGGAGMGKSAMCVVTEELSRGYIGLGSLGTRSEIAAELIRANGTEAQKARWLPGIASGAVLPSAAFTEPDVGSDLASIRTRAELVADAAPAHWRVHGAKTWTTHGARSDLMTLLVRTEPAETGHRGLSMFLAAKPRGTDAAPFPAAGMQGTEIEVLGYRGMKEYEIAFDGFRMPPDALLGGVRGQGFRQLMQTFESARIQTAARAVGVAQNAFELGLGYALSRKQFGQQLIAFARVADKLAWMAVETMIARQLTLYAAREKDGGRRCDLEAGMAKLLAARVAWANADCAVQIHGGNGYALEYPVSRVLVDARILSVFEGAAEIQANIVARALLERG
ncbi:MAG: acyl-CoA/acyl-ACP dehydrogenase [Burkholderiaceae bacterium]|nr:acyl-CoA/acyl-ACP dehydrogenase [Burkholderiaceae bacterium]